MVKFEQVAAVTMLGVLGYTAPWVWERCPLQTPGWDDYDRKAGILVYFEAAGIMAALGLLMHLLWYVFVNKSVRSANAFSQMVLSSVYVYTWLSIWFYGVPAPFTIGAQSGSCAGYELYGLISEILMWVLGEAKRKDFIAHHLMCVVFTLVTVVAYVEVPHSDVVVWHIVWDSISRMLGSNILLGARYFSNKKVLPFTNALFFVMFLFVRWVEQVPLALEMWREVPPIFPFESISTMLTLLAWVSLTTLNLYWGALIVMTGLGLKAKPKVKSE